MKAKQIIEWLRSKLGDDYTPVGNRFWIEHDYAFGDTEVGFSSAYTIDYDALEKEIDEWIAKTFPKEQQ